MCISHRPKTARPRKFPHVMVQHNYHDHAADAIVPENCNTDRHSRGGVAEPFPHKLFHMLSDVEDPTIVSWQPHGRCFVVHNPSKFQLLLPKYFKLSKIASFQRQLNLYGFQRLTAHKSDKGGYYHEFFLQYRPDLVCRIVRTKVKGTNVRGKANPSAEPNFWAMEWASSIASALKVPSQAMVPKVEDQWLSSAAENQTATSAVCPQQDLSIVSDNWSSSDSDSCRDEDDDDETRIMAMMLLQEGVEPIEQDLNKTVLSEEDRGKEDLSEESFSNFSWNTSVASPDEDFFHVLLDTMFDCDQRYSFRDLQQQCGVAPVSL